MSDRATRYLARVDRHLPTVADGSARRRFLDQQIAAWERRYARFIATDGASEPRASGPYADPSTPPNAADFLLTITGLGARLEMQKDEPIRGLCGLLAEAGARP